MGEAKIRNATESTYGKFPKDLQKRGLIVSNPISINIGSNSFSAKGGLDPNELRFSLLYWDKLVHPRSNFIIFGGADDEEFLVSAGVLTEPIYQHLGGGIASIVLDTYLRAFFELENLEPGVWSLSQGEKSLFINNSAANFIDDSGLSLELLKAVPVPGGDVPLAEILQFKDRRKDELMVLRTHIDSLVLEIQNSPARTDDFNRIAKGVDAACADLLKVGHEWQYPVHFADFKATFNFNPARFGGAVKNGWDFGEPHGLLAATAVAAAAGLASTIDVKSDISLRSIKKPRSAFRYCHLAHKELV